MNEETKAMEKEKKARPSLCPKNTLFLHFLLLATLFCFQKIRQRLRQMDYNAAMAVYAQGIEHLSIPAFQDGAKADFQDAANLFQEAIRASTDEAFSQKATEMLSCCYAMMARCPQTTATEALALYRHALSLHPNCPEVDDLTRARLLSMPEQAREMLLHTLQDSTAP